jgi:hypothetical protein
LNHHDSNPTFFEHLLETDESMFTRNGIINYHNSHHWADENPHVVHVSYMQRQFFVNIWAGIIGDDLIGPFRLPHRLSDPTYLNFLNNDLPLLLEDVPLLTRRRMWFQHDGAPAHFTLAVRRWLHEHYPGRWIGRRNGTPVHWPSRSPDLSPMDFIFGVQ